MKKLFSAFTLLMFLALPSFALSDSDYTRMMRDSKFSDADSNLNTAYSEAKSSLAPDVFADLKKSQSEWLKSGRDSDAQKFMKSESLSETEAYAKALNSRAEYIRSFVKSKEDSDPYGEFADTLTKTAEKLISGKPSFVDGSSKIWKHDKYIIAKSGEILAEFFTADPSMTFAGGIKVGSTENDVKKFFGNIDKSDKGVYYTGGIHQWAVLNAKDGKIMSIDFVQSDAGLSEKAYDTCLSYIKEISD